MNGDARQGASLGHEGVLGCKEAAAMLAVPPMALRIWSERLSFPHNVGDGGTPRYRRDEIEALRDALTDAHSVTGAIRAARRRLGVPV